MICERRPRISDFEGFLGSEVSVSGEESGADFTWRLEEIEEIAKAPLKELEGEDCFTLVFDVETRLEQDLFLIRGVNGEVFKVLGVPTMGKNGVAMQVTIN